MRKTLLAVLTLLCAAMVTMGVGTACNSNCGGSSVSSEIAQNLVIKGRPEGDIATITDAVNTLTLTCDEADVTWASSNTAVATVEKGIVTLHAAGSTVISVKKGEKTGDFILTVVDGRIPALATVTITGMPKNGEVQFDSGSVQLSATCSDGSVVVWSSNDETVATVDETGKVTFVSPGCVDIVAQKEGETRVYGVCTLNIVTAKANYEDFSTAVVIGNYVVGEIEIRDASNALSPEIVYDEAEDNYYLKYSHAKADGNNKYMIYSFGGLETGARYVLKYNMKVLSKEGTYNHQINLYSDKDVPVVANDPLVGNVYNWHTTGLDTDDAKIYQSGSGALYRDGVRWTGSADSMDDFHEYTLGFIAGESSVGFAFVCNNTYEVLFDYICVEKAPVLDEYKLISTERLPIGENYQLKPVAVEDVVYYQPFKLTYTSSDETVATVNEKGVVTALKEGEVTITATNVNGAEQAVNITVIPMVDSSVYDLWYEGSREAIEQTHELAEAVKGGVQYDTVEVKLSLDLVKGIMPRIKFYLLNTAGKQITDPADNGWITVADYYDETTETYTFLTEFKWATGNWDVGSIKVVVEDGEYKLGVDVVSVQVLEDPNAVNYDLWYVGRKTAMEKTHQLAEVVMGGVQYDTVEVKLSLDLIKGTMPRIKFYLLNTDGQQITDPADNGWITVADYYEEATETYTFTTEFKWLTGNWNVGAIKVVTEDGAYKLGVNVVSVKVLEDTALENYDLSFVSSLVAVEQTRELAEAVKGGVQYDTVEVKLSLDLIKGTMPRIKFYLLNTAGKQITDPADNGWITVADYYEEATETYTFTTEFKWLTGNWDIGAIKVIAEDGEYRLGINVISVQVLEDPNKANYDLWLAGALKTVEQTYVLSEAVSGGVQYDTVEVKLSLDLVKGTMPKIKFYLLNTAGVQITPAEQWLTIADGYNGATGTYTFTTVFRWATGNWDVGSIKVITLMENDAYRLGVNVLSIARVDDPNKANFDLWYAGTSQAVEQTYVLPETVTGGEQYDTVEVKLSLDIIHGTMPRIKFYLLNTEGVQITDPADNGWITVAEGENTITATFKWPTGNWDVGSIKIIVADGSYRLGVDILSIAKVEDPNKANYDLWYAGTSQAVEQTYVLPEVITGGDQYDTATVKLSLDIIHGAMPKIKFYLLDTDGEQITNFLGDGWISVADYYDETTDVYTFTTMLNWVSDNVNVGSIMIIAESGVYRLGVDVISVRVFEDPVAAAYDVWFVGASTATEGTFTLNDAVTGGAQYDTAEVKLSFDLVNGTMPRIKFYLLNTDGQQITDPAENGWITVTEGENTVTATFKWATGNWDIGALWLLVEDGSYRLGVDVVSVNVIADTTGENYDLWYVGTTESIEQTYTLTEAVTGGVRYDMAEVKLSLDLLNGTMPRIKFYLLNTDGQQITDPAENGWISVVEGENTVTATFKWATGNWDIGAITVIVEDGTYRLGVDVADVKIVKDTTGDNYDLWYVGTTEAVVQTYELTEAVTGGAQYDTAEVKLSFDLLEGEMPRIKFYLINTEGQQITDPAENGWISVVEGENTVTATFKWATGNWDIGALWLLVEDGSYRLGVDVVSVNVIADTTGENYDLWYVGTTESIEQTYTLTEAVTGGVRYDMAEVKLSLDLLNGTMPRIKFYLLNTDGEQITDPADNGWITVTEGENTLTATFKWATGNWNVGAIKVIAEDGSYRLGVDVNEIELQETAYQLEYSLASGSQAQVFAFDTVAGGTQNGYVKVTFDVAVFYGTLTNIQFNLCTDTTGSTTVANSNKAWNEDGTKITSSGGQISMSNLTGKKTVTIVTTFPWANGNWDLQSISLQLYGTNLQAGVSNIQVELLSDFTPAA